MGPETSAALADPVVPSPGSTHGRVVEIDKTRQLLYTVLDGDIEWVFHISTGMEEPYQHPNGYSAMADTPPGAHSVFWEVDGWQEGVTGAAVPAQVLPRRRDRGPRLRRDPASPSVARLGSSHLSPMDFIWDNGLMPMGSTVLVYGESPRGAGRVNCRWRRRGAHHHHPGLPPPGMAQPLAGLRAFR